MQSILELEKDLTAKAASRRKLSAGEQKIGLLGTLFGCWHKRLTKPMTVKNDSYRACLECGARRKFNTENFKTSGPFYYPPSVQPETVRQGT
jgi:hypothetical protein